MHKPPDWSDAARSPFGLLSDAWAQAARHQRPPAPASRITLAPRPRWAALVAPLVPAAPLKRDPGPGGVA